MSIWLFVITLWGLGDVDADGKRHAQSYVVEQGFFYSKQECLNYKRDQGAEYKAKGVWTYTIVCSERSGPLLEPERAEAR